MRVRFLKHGNMLTVDPSHAGVQEAVERELLFEETRQLRGKNMRRRPDGSLQQVERINWRAFIRDRRGRTVCPFGFHYRLRRALTLLGHEVDVVDLSPPPDDRYVPVWERLFDPVFPLTLREYQLETLFRIFGNWCGRISASPAAGKTYILAAIAHVIPECKIHVVSKDKDVIQNTIYPHLCRYLTDVGMVGGGKKKPNHRVVCYTADSLHRSEADADVVLADECHQLASHKAHRELSRYQWSRNFGFSATQDMRPDGLDFRVEGIFGPIIQELPYSLLLSYGAVAPIEIYWREVPGPDPIGGLKEPTARKRHGYWRNDTRNQVIAEDARRYDDSTQVLIMAETLDHLVHLKYYLPEFTLVYAVQGSKDDETRWQRFKNQGLIADDAGMITERDRAEYKERFERGELKKVIASPVWNQGVSFDTLSVLIRADGGSSPVGSIQIPGRAMRLSADKDRGIIHDYIDSFNDTLKRRSEDRFRTYRDYGWSQYGWPTRGRQGRVVS